MKKSLFLVFFLNLLFISKIYPQWDNSWDNSNASFDSVKDFNFSTFIYKNVRYPIVDSVTRSYYGDEKYAKSFRDFVPADTVIKTKFSLFFLERSKIPYVCYLYNGYYNRKQIEEKPLEKKKVYFEFILFFIVLPILMYLMGGDVEIGKYDSFWVKDNLTTLLFCLLFVLFFKLLLFEIIPYFIKLDYDKIISFFGSKTLYTFVFYVVILSIIYSIPNNFIKFLLSDFISIVFAGIIVAILVGISFEEISYISASYISVIGMVGYLIIAFFVEVLFLYFYEKYKNKKTITIKSSEEESKIEENIT